MNLDILFRLTVHMQLSLMPGIAQLKCNYKPSICSIIPDCSQNLTVYIIPEVYSF